MQIVDIELHDARVARISIMPKGIVRIEFAHISVYVKADEGSVEVWSARAALELDDVTRIEARGAFQPDDYISDGTFVDDSGAEIAELKADHLKRARRLDLLFAGSGSEIHFSMATASFTMERLLKKLEDWDGPPMGSG